MSRRVKVGSAILGGVAVALLGMSVPALAAPGGDGQAAVPVPVPQVSGPVVTQPRLDNTRGIPYTASAIDLDSNGYTEQEYFVSGSARSYASDTPLTTDGKWQVRQDSTAAYKTRIIVREPIDMSKFSGNVVVEWLNATTGRDLDVGWTFGGSGLIHDDDIYVGVSAQATVINSPTGLKAWDPDRYGSLVHPGDQYSYDIFAQVGEAIRTPGTTNPIDNAKIRSVIAYGDSQSAARLTTYADALQNRDQVFDGIILNSRSASPAALNTTTTVPLGTQIRTDIVGKVFTLETESDVANATTGYVHARQADSDNFRLWEVAGASHIDTVEEALQRIQVFREWPTTQPPVQLTTCAQPIGTLRFNDVVDTVFHVVPNWINKNQAPARVDRLEVTPDGASYMKNPLGLAEGGLRLPQVTVPIGVNSGSRTNTGTANCSLIGTFTAFSPAQLATLYPSHSDYVARYTAAVEKLGAQGFIQPYDAAANINVAKRSAIPSLTYVP
jgi:hypothetical protein